MTYEKYFAKNLLRFLNFQFDSFMFYLSLKIETENSTWNLDGNGKINISKVGKLNFVLHLKNCLVVMERFVEDL